MGNTTPHAISFLASSNFSSPKTETKKVDNFSFEDVAF